MSVLTRVMLVSLALLGLAGCAEGLPVEELVDGEDQAQHGLITPTKVPSVPVYLGVTNHLTVTDDTSAVYTVFELLPKARVLIRLERTAGSEPGSVGFKLHRVRDAGTLRFMRGVDGADGTAETSLRSVKGGTYVVEVASDPHPAYLALDLACATAKCSPTQQPGEICGGDPGPAMRRGALLSLRRRELRRRRPGRHLRGAGRNVPARLRAGVRLRRADLRQWLRGRQGRDVGRGRGRVRRAGRLPAVLRRGRHGERRLVRWLHGPLHSARRLWRMHGDLRRNRQSERGLALELRRPDQVGPLRLSLALDALRRARLRSPDRERAGGGERPGLRGRVAPARLPRAHRPGPGGDGRGRPPGPARARPPRLPDGRRPGDRQDRGPRPGPMRLLRPALPGAAVEHAVTTAPTSCSLRRGCGRACLAR